MPWMCSSETTLTKTWLPSPRLTPYVRMSIIFMNGGSYQGRALVPGPGGHDIAHRPRGAVSRVLIVQTRAGHKSSAAIAKPSQLPLIAPALRFPGGAAWQKSNDTCFQGNSGKLRLVRNHCDSSVFDHLQTDTGTTISACPRRSSCRFPGVKHLASNLPNELRSRYATLTPRGAIPPQKHHCSLLNCQENGRAGRGFLLSSTPPKDNPARSRGETNSIASDAAPTGSPDRDRRQRPR